MRWTATLMTSPSTLLKAVSQLSTAWGNPWLVSLSSVYVSLWTGLINTKEWKKTSCKGKEKRRLSLKGGGISSRTDATVTVRGDISQGQYKSTNTQKVNTVFRELVHQVLEKIKNEPFLKWSNKMAGDSMKRNQSLYCQYHQDHGHTIEDYRNLWNHLDQLVQEGKLRHLLHPSSGHQG